MEFEKKRIVIGTKEQWDQKSPITIDLHERSQHVYVIGQTGTGKSTLLQSLILQDIEAGHGVCLIDPHGDFAKKILDHIPRHRTEDVVYFDPASPSPMAINLLRTSTDNWYLTASGIVSSFKKVWHSSWGPRLEYILFATVAALIQAKHTSLMGVSRMLNDARYRRWVVRQVTDPMVRSFWVNEFEMYDRKFLQEIIAPIQNKIGQLMFSPPIRHILGQVKSKVDFRFMMDHKRIFIANLSKGHLGETHSSLLGSLLITGFEIAALSRADSPEHERKPFFLYADEFQNYATDSFASILSESRKYQLSMTLAHQYTAQLDEDVSDAVFGNVGTFISFRVGESDATLLQKQYGGDFSKTRLSNLENFEICARFPNREPIFGKSLPPSRPKYSRGRTIIRRSAEKYGTPRKVVEDKIDRWLKRRH